MKTEEPGVNETGSSETDSSGMSFEQEQEQEQGRAGADRRHCKKRDHCKGPCYDKDNLYSLMRACGRHLYHCSKGSGQGKILAILSERKKMTQKELQEILQIQSGSMSEILAKLEEKGLIWRSRDEVDKRRSVLELTEAGCEWVRKYALQRDEQTFFRVLKEEEQEALKKLLGRLLEDWKQEEEAVKTHKEETGAE